MLLAIPDTNLAAFVTLDLVLGAAAAWMAGRTLAREWRSAWQVVVYTVLLAAAVRFLHFAIGGGKLLSPAGIAIDFAVLVAVALLSYRVMRTTQMVCQYPWLYRRTSLISWAAKQE